MSGKILVMQPGNVYSLLSAGDRITFDDLRLIIGGWVGIALRVPPAQIKRLLPNTKSKNGMIIFCDDEGYLKGLQPTCTRAGDNHVLVGPVVYTRYKNVFLEDGPDEIYSSLDDEQLNDLVTLLKQRHWAEIIMDEIPNTGDELIMSGDEAESA